MTYRSSDKISLFSFCLILLSFIGFVLSGLTGQITQICQHFSVMSQSYKLLNVSHKSAQYVCINGYDHSRIWGIWAVLEIIVQTEHDSSVNVIMEKSCENVYEKYYNQSSSWFSGFQSWFRHRNKETRKTFSVSPYGIHCLAIHVDPPQSIESLQVVFHKLKLLYPITMILGIVLIFTADAITRSILFYYTAGISVGMILAVFLLLFIISKFMPQRGIGYAFMFCGSSIILYFVQLLKDQIMKGNFADMKLFYVYFILAGIISFLYCYYRGPIESSRGLDIMRWSLQSVALFMVYYSVRCEEISLMFVLVLIATKWISLPGISHYVLTRGWIPYRLQAYFLAPRLITMEEYEKEGKIETAKALRELREYCESPKCNAWKTVSRLKSPKRFASFMSDGLDVTPDERREYEETSFDLKPFLTSDEDDSPDELSIGEL